MLLDGSRGEVSVLTSLTFGHVLPLDAELNAIDGGRSTKATLLGLRSSERRMLWLSQRAGL
jgi:hypothetical protein